MRQGNSLKSVNEYVLSLLDRKALEPGDAEKARRILRKLNLAWNGREWKRLDAAVGELARFFTRLD
jgi:hypothetical protein